VARSVVERYAVAAFAFMAAAIWLGVSLTGGFTCLFVFVVALQAVRLYQRRSDVRTRRRDSRREPRSRPEHAAAEQRAFPPPLASASARSQPAARVYDGDREQFSRPAATQASW
jgi:hypothetical protein